mmetsp:Transcript_57816/g.67474  ORF Transcript_57816/g.67474 Transcript_57816/m.67474 type:complete len:207 (-) Transcript_57816:160-780(-)
MIFLITNTNQHCNTYFDDEQNHLQPFTNDSSGTIQTPQQMNTSVSEGMPASFIPRHDSDSNRVDKDNRLKNLEIPIGHADDDSRSSANSSNNVQRTDNRKHTVSVNSLPNMTHTKSSVTTQLSEDVSDSIIKEDRSNTNDCCGICLSDYECGDIIMHARDDKCCNHEFHKSCLLTWLDRNDICPMCRGFMVTPSDFKNAALHQSFG